MSRYQTLRGPVTTRKVGANGKISFAGQVYPVAVWLAGETVEVTVEFQIPYEV